MVHGSRVRPSEAVQPPHAAKAAADRPRLSRAAPSEGSANDPAATICPSQATISAENASPTPTNCCPATAVSCRRPCHLRGEQGGLEEGGVRRSHFSPISLATTPQERNYQRFMLATSSFALSFAPQLAVQHHAARAATPLMQVRGRYHLLTCHVPAATSHMNELPPPAAPCVCACWSTKPRTR